MSTAANNNHLETGHEELFSTSVNRAYLFSKLLDERAPENCFDSKADIQSTRDYLIEILVQDIANIKACHDSADNMPLQGDRTDISAGVIRKAA